MRRWHLSKRERRRVLGRIGEQFPRLQLGDPVLEVVVEDDVELLLADGEPAFIRVGDTLIPHLKFLLKRGYGEWLPAIVVDEGAVKPIARGADLMRPGIVEIRGVFGRGDIVVVVEPTRGLPLAVHRALYTSDEILAMERGRVAESLHHLGDRYWRLAEKL